MNFPYTGYTELAQGYTYCEDSPAITDDELSYSQLVHDNSSPHLLKPYSSLRTYSTDQSIIPYPLPAENCVYEDLNGMPTVMWVTPSEQGTIYNGPVLHSFNPSDFVYTPDTFSPGHHVTYTPENTYTRMFRGRKSKSASEVMDELRPYACDICQAAFARSHDRDRHKRSHTGETPYHCHGCGTGFKRPDARKRHWERDPVCAQEDWLRVRHTPEGAKRRSRAKTKPIKKESGI